MDKPTQIQTSASIHISGGNFLNNTGRIDHLTTHNHTTPLADPRQILEHHCSPNAIHMSEAVDSQDMCLPGTRTFTLRRLQSLVSSTNKNDPDIIWMHGPAGAGKSAIMRTMANQLDDDGALLASFFFFRADGTRNTATPFIPTLASQVAAAVPDARPRILDQCRTYGVFSQAYRRQSRTLLEAPLVATMQTNPTSPNMTTPFVLVVDGLDECCEVKGRAEIIGALFQLTTMIRTKSNRRLKILIASRPEHDIKSQMEAFDSAVTVIQLDPSDANIDLYYDTQLEKMRRRHGLPPTWPSPWQVTWLREKTSGQYSFAHVSMGFLDEGDPVARLKMLEDDLPTHGLRPFDSLDALYATIFHQLPPEMLESALLFVNMRLRLQVSPFRSLGPGAGELEALLQLPTGYASRLSIFLSSLFKFSHYAVTPYHASLGDFFASSVRSGKHGLFVEDTVLANALLCGLISCCTYGRQSLLLTFELEYLRVPEPLLNKISRPAKLASELESLTLRLDDLDGRPMESLSLIVHKMREVHAERPDALDPYSQHIINITLPRLKPGYIRGKN